MAVSRVKTWVAGEILTAADLNSEFDNILNNAESLAYPASSSKDFNAQEIILDDDGDTSITADTDDQIDFQVGGSDVIRMLSSGLTAISSDAGATGAPDVILHRDSASPADDDVMGRLILRGEDSASDATDYVILQGEIADATDTTEAGRLRILPLLTGEVIIEATDAAATLGPELTLYRNSASPADDDIIGQVSFDGEDDGGTQTEFAAIQGQIVDTTDATEDGRLLFKTMSGGSTVESMRMDGTTVTMIDSDAGATIGPLFVLYRNSSSPADADVLGGIEFDGEDSAGNQELYARIYAVADDVTTATEDGSLYFQTKVNGSNLTRLILGAGLYTVGATGGDQGTNTINATKYYTAGEPNTVYAGYVDSTAAAEDVPSGWSVTNPTTGDYTITHNLSVSDNDKFNVTASCIGNPGAANFAEVTARGANSFDITCYDDTGSEVSVAFNFIAIHRE